MKTENETVVRGINELKGGTYAISGTSTLSRLQTAGALLDAAVARLQEI